MAAKGIDRREVEERMKALNKATSAREKPAIILTMLEDLRKDLVPTKEILRDTKVGQLVGKMRSFENIDPAVASKCGQMIAEWKRAVGPRTSQTNDTKPASPAPATNGTSTPKPVTNGNGILSPKKAEIDPEKRTHKTDGVKIETYPNERPRNNTVQLLYDGLVQGSSEPSATVLSKAEEVELAIFNMPAVEASSSSSAYKDKVRTLYQNLKNKANPDLKRHILNGLIAPQRLVTMTHDELKSKEQREEDERIAKENLNNAMVAQEEQSISSTLECGKCKKKMVAFTQAQTRSADEPMTTFCRCTNCGNRWKFC